VNLAWRWSELGGKPKFGITFAAELTARARAAHERATKRSICSRRLLEQRDVHRVTSAYSTTTLPVIFG
jgi:hypothetical protein